MSLLSGRFVQAEANKGQGRATKAVQRCWMLCMPSRLMHAASKTQDSYRQQIAVDPFVQCLEERSKQQQQQQLSKPATHGSTTRARQQPVH